MSPRAKAWPAPADALAAGAAFLADLPADAATLVVADRDVDGLCAGVIVERTASRLGRPAEVLVAPRGEHVHEDRLRARIRALAPARLVVVDMGSRAGPIVMGIPTLIIDHHAPSGTPEGALLVSASGHEPVAPTSLLAWHLAGRVVDVADLAWLALLGSAGDLGDDLPFPELRAAAAGATKTDIRETVALLNAARRAPEPRAEVALAALRAARSARDVARGLVPGVDILRACRAEVAAEVSRCARVAPRYARPVPGLPPLAIVRFSSPAQIHPLLATRWARRLRNAVVVAANDGYLPGRVNFALRAGPDLRGEVDLLALLRGLLLGRVEGEFANGHPQATGGSVPPSEFERILEALGFASAAPEIHA